MAFIISAVYIVLIYITPTYLVPVLAPYRVQIWVVSAAGLASLGALMGRRISVHGPQFYLCLAFLAAIGFSRLMQRWFGGILLAWWDFLPSLAVFLLIFLNARLTSKLRVLQVLLVLVSLYIVITGSVAYHTGVGESSFVMEYTFRDEVSGEDVGDIRRLRFLGIIGDPNDLAQFLLMMLPLVWMGWRGNMAWNLVVVVAPSAAILYGVYLTRSRGALLGLAAVLALAMRDRLKTFGAAVVTVVAVGGLVVFGFTGGRSLSFRAGVDRLQIWSDGLQWLKSSPLWGIGYRYFTDHSEHTAHNSFLLVATELGLPGYIIWLSLFVVCLLQLQAILKGGRAAGADPEILRHAWGIRLSLYAYLVTAWFLSRAYLPTPYLALGMATALTEMEMERRKANLLTSNRFWPVLTMAAGIGLILLVYILVRLRAV